MHKKISNGSYHFIIFALLSFLILIIYSNTFHASFHLDDDQNILRNPLIQINDFSWDSIWGTFHASYDNGNYNSKNIYRPIPCFSFALNWYLGGPNVVGYHAVNITIHIITSFLLFLAILNLLKSPNLIGNYNNGAHFISLLAACLWAVNPIQTQAVTYIVQRMTAMAAMFYILSILFYLKGRVEASKKKRILFFLSCFISFLGGIASKENAILVPFSLILIEIIFFQNLKKPEIKRRLFYMSLLCLIFTIILSALFLQSYNGAISILNFSNRPFTQIERLLTEPRIVLFYLSQIFYPIPQRLSIEHSVDISTSLLHPWTTLPSILLILFIIGFGILKIRKYPILSFSILFFFLNLSIESTFLSLELLFEHRNYIPSFFLFLPLSVFLKKTIDLYYNKNRSMYIIVVSFIILLLIGLGTGTYIRNLAWRSEKTLWEDVLIKAPKSARALTNFALGYHQKKGNYDEATKLYKEALPLYEHSNLGALTAINNIANNLFYFNKDYDNALKYWQEAADKSPAGFEIYRFRLALAAAKAGYFNTSLKNINIVISRWPDNCQAINLKGLLLLRKGNPKNAISYFNKCLKIQPDDSVILLNTGIAFYYLKNYKRAEFYLQSALQHNKNDFLTIVWLIETNLHIGDKDKTEKYIDILLSDFSVNTLVLNIKKVNEKEFVTPVPGDETINYLLERLLHTSNEIESLLIQP